MRAPRRERSALVELDAAVGDPVGGLRVVVGLGAVGEAVPRALAARRSRVRVVVLVQERAPPSAARRLRSETALLRRMQQLTLGARCASERSGEAAALAATWALRARRRRGAGITHLKNRRRTATNPWSTLSHTCIQCGES